MSDGDFSLTRRGAMQSSAAVGITALGSTVLGNAAMAAPAVGVSIDAARKSDPFGKYIFGALIEHIAGGINYSLWSEVLEDRKFYWAVGTISRCPQPRRRARLAAHRHQPGCRQPGGPATASLCQAGDVRSVIEKSHRGAI
jgi:alpha-N-arabinofuranosidase